MVVVKEQVDNKCANDDESFGRREADGETEVWRRKTRGLLNNGRLARPASNRSTPFPRYYGLIKGYSVVS